jgi:aspartate racemase
LAELIDLSVYPKDYLRYAQAHWQALRTYRPQPYSGRITLFRTRKQPILCLDSTLGWGQFAKAGVATNIMPGTHEKMLAEPNVQVLASELKACLAEAQDRAERDPEPECLTESSHPMAEATPWPWSVIT